MLPILYADIIDQPDQRQLFEQIYCAHRKEMLLAAQQILLDYHEAEDAVHDAFIGIARNMNTVRRITRPEDLRYYVLRAAKNAALDHAQRPHRKAERPAELSDRIPDSSVWDALCAQTDFHRLLEVIAALPVIYREALYYHFVLEFTIGEVAQLLHISPSAAKQRLVRGKKLLLAAWKKEGYCTYGND